MQDNFNGNIKVSVICLAYNHEKYIRQALEGFVKQKTNFRYEVLIHDDASTDRTADIIREYAEKFPDIIKPVFQKENQYSQGVKIGRKYLYPKVKGKYIAFCEGDDYWTDEHKLQKQFDVMEQNPNCSICTHKVQCINEDGTLNKRIIPSRKYGIRGGLQDKKTMAESIWYKGYPFHTSSYFIRFDCVSECENYDYANYFYGDQVLLRAALNSGDFWYIDEEMSFYRLSSVGSVTDKYGRSPYKIKREFRFNRVVGDILFDKVSDKKFHVYISRRVSGRVLDIAQGDLYEYQIPFKKTYYELLDKFGISGSEAFRALDLRNRIKYFLLCFSPDLYIWLKRLPYKFKGMFMSLIKAG